VVPDADEEEDVLLAKRVAVVTGAGSGIGREIAETFAREGARVAVLDRSREAAQETLDALIAVGASDPLLFAVDVRSAAEVDEAMQSVVVAAGRIDVLVNCAGVREIGDVYTMPADEWENVIAINLTGTFYCCQSAARRMRDGATGGSIVNLASVGGLIGLSHRPAYTAAKHGIVGLTKSLARDLAPAGIRVNALCPGVIRTPMTEQYFSDESFEQELAISVPLGRYGDVRDVAHAALYLASDGAGYVTGVALPVDGGWLAEKSFVGGSGASFLAGHTTRSSVGSTADDGRSKA
jgi:NAD(P)-dependent dehydrogenase (short-subunit alcohol dehydrogenase family)